MTQCEHQQTAGRASIQHQGMVALVLLSGWILIFGYALFSLQLHWAAGVAGLWLSYNFLCWLVPEWRLAILSRRGNSVGLGFAMAGGAVITLGLSGGMSLGNILVSIMVNTLLLYLPFAVILLAQLPAGRPHWLDLVFSMHILAMPFFWPFDSALVPGSTMRLGGFIAAATAVTLFLGARFWSRTKWELSVNKDDLKRTLLASTVVVLAVWLDPFVSVTLKTVHWIDAVYRGAVLAPVSTLLLFGVVRAVLRGMLPVQEARTAQTVASIVSAVLFVALSYVTFQGWGLSTVVLAAVCGYLAGRTRDMGPVGVVSMIGYVLFTLVHST